MKLAICYYSRHHGNTLKVLEAIAARYPVDLINVTTREAVHLEEYRAVGFASGIYFYKFHPAVAAFARQYLPRGKDSFLLATYGIPMPGYGREMEQVLREKDSALLGRFGCRGYDTFGPLAKIGGIARSHPDQRDLDRALAFWEGLLKKLEKGE